jgi:RNA polymerase sigma factor (sigma-70 family)
MSVHPVIYVVDDDAAILKAVCRLLRASGYEVRPFDSPRAFLEKHDPEVPGCAVLDVAMPGLDGLELQEALAASDSDRQVIFVTGEGDIPTSVRAMRAGAADFLTKPVDEEVLLAAIKVALERDRRARESRESRLLVERRLATLTPRERQVLELVVAGRLNKQIAAQLGTGEKTVKVHRARVMEKMNVRSVADLVRGLERARERDRDPPRAASARP